MDDYNNIIEDFNRLDQENKQLRDEYDWVPLTDAPKYIENFKLKEAYTKEEIDAIEPEFVKGYKIIEEAKASNSK